MAYPTGYTKYQEITIDHTKVDADLTDYIVYVDLANLVKAGADIFDTCRTDGGDIRATKSDGTTQLPCEVVTIDTTAKTGELHIKFTGTLSGSTNTIIRIYYNGTDTALAATDTYGRNNVWASNYDLVHHFQDVTANAVNGNSPVSNTFSYATTGKFGKGVNQTDGSTRGMDWDTSVPMNTSTMTVSSWFKSDEAFSQENGNMIIFSYSRPSSPFERFVLSMSMGGVTADRGKMSIALRNSSTLYTAQGSVQYNDGLWHLAHGVYNGSTLKIFVDGVERLSISAAAGTVGAGFKTTLGTNWDEAASDVWVDDYDEVRATDSLALASTWISTEYNNQNSPSTFYTVSDEQTGGAILVSATVQSATFTIPAYTQKSNVINAPATQSIVSSIPAYTTKQGVLVSQGTNALVFTIPAYVVSEGGTNILVGTQAMTFTIPAYTVKTYQIVMPDGQTLTFTLPARTIVSFANITITPDTVELTFTAVGVQRVGSLWRKSSRNSSGTWTKLSRNSD